jgi:hypothetical protein
MYDVDIFKEERKAALEKGMVKGKLEGKIETLRPDIESPPFFKNSLACHDNIWIVQNS